MTLEDLYKQLRNELEEINAYLEKPMSDEPALLVERLMKLQGYLGRMPRILSDCKFLVLRAKALAGSSAEMEGLSPTQAKFRIEGMITKELTLEVLADRTEATLKHCIEATRSILSYNKETLNDIQ